MGFREGAFATFWEARPNRSGNSTSVRLSISKKAEDGKYEDDFAGYVLFIKAAHTKASSLKKGDRIKLGGTDVSSQYNADKNTRNYTFKVFSFEMADGSKSAAKSKKSNSLDAMEEDDTPDDLPF